MAEDPKDQAPAEETKAEAAPQQEAPAKTEEKKEEKKPAPSTGKKVSTEDLIATIEQMTIVELNDLVKTLEDKFGITAAAPVAVAAAGAAPAGGDAAAPAEEKTEFTVMITDGGASKINVIKVVRKYNQALGLKEAKDLVENPPKAVVENVKKEEADTIKKELEEAGAKVELK